MAKPYLWLKAVVPLFAVCVWFRGTGLANGSLGYLPTVGPVPVRFQPLLPAVPTAPWPPLRQQELPVTKTEALSGGRGGRNRLDRNCSAVVRDCRRNVSRSTSVTAAGRDYSLPRAGVELAQSGDGGRG